MWSHRLVITAVILTLVSTTVYAFTPDSNTSFYVPFDECAGSTVTDDVVSHAGTLTGGTWHSASECIGNCCLEFDGVDDRLSFSDNSALDQAGSYTVAFWVRDIEIGVDECPIFSKPTDVGDLDNNYLCYFESAGGDVECGYRTGTTLKTDSQTVTNDTDWQCIVFTKNSTDSRVTVDGTGTWTANVNNADTNNGALSIGYYSGSGYAWTPDYANMWIDEFTIQNDTVDQTWINSFCNSTAFCDLCGSWHNTGQCLNGYENQTRVCPSGFDCDTEQWVATDYCSLILNQSLGIYQQNYYHYTGSDVCTTDEIRLRDGNNVVTCTLEVEVPENCVNITSDVEVTPVWVDAGIGCNHGNYSLQAFNPDLSSEQELDTWVCTDLNHTINNTYTSYVAGETVTGRAIMSVDSDCRCPLFFNAEWSDVGVTNYKMVATMSVECIRPYSEGWLCEDNLRYEQYQHIDGSITNRTPCDYGCNNNTGRCYSTLVSSPDDSRSPSFWISNIFSPDDDAKIIHGFVWSLVIGGSIVAIASSMNNGKISGGSVGMLFLTGFGIGLTVFTVFGWLPIWIMVAIILVGLGGVAIKMLS